MASTKKKMDATKFKAFWRRICTSLCKIHLVDKCLLLLMLVLLSQSAYVLLTNGGNSTEANHIDVIVRTAAASIFGYFLSANFVMRNAIPKSDMIVVGKTTALDGKSTRQCETPQNGIGFMLTERSTELERGNTTSQTVPPEDENATGVGRLQILTATAIALFCLIALVLVRDIVGNDETINASTTAVISQFRDFVSGCVGFLIGCPTTK